MSDSAEVYNEELDDGDIEGQKSSRGSNRSSRTFHGGAEEEMKSPLSHSASDSSHMEEKLEIPFDRKEFKRLRSVKVGEKPALLLSSAVR